MTLHNESDLNHKSTPKNEQSVSEEDIEGLLDFREDDTEPPTGAPTPDEYDTTDDLGDPDESFIEEEYNHDPASGATTQKFHENPFAKFVMVGLIGGVAAVAASMFMGGLFSFKSKQKVAKVVPDTPVEETPVVEEPSDEGKLLTELALSRQAEQMGNGDKKKITPASSTASASGVSGGKASGTPASRPTKAYTPPPPKSYASYSPPPRVTPRKSIASFDPGPPPPRPPRTSGFAPVSTSADTGSSSTASAKSERSTSQKSPPEDPQQLWNKLAKIGSYGEVKTEDESQPTAKKPPQQTQVAQMPRSIPVAYPQPGYPPSAVGSSPYPYPYPYPSQSFPPQAAPIPSSRSNQADPQTFPDYPDTGIEINPGYEPETQINLSRGPSDLGQGTLVASSNFAEPSDLGVSGNIAQADAPAVNMAEEASILYGQSQELLLMGSVGSGILETPLALRSENSESGSTDTFVTVLEEPILTSSGAIYFPAGTRFIFLIKSISESGQVEMPVVAAVVDDREMPLPPGVIQIRGEGQQPLIANKFRNKGKSILPLDASLALSAGISRASGLFNRTQSKVVVNDSSTVVSEENPEPSILAGVLEGSTQALTEILNDRNEKAIEGIEKQKNVWFLKAGTPVTVYVNRSMSL